MDTPESTLLVVLQVVSWILTLLMFVAIRQERHRDGVALWAAVFAIQAVSQSLRELVQMGWGHLAGLPIGHLGGPIAYAVLYVGIRRYLGLLPQTRFVIVACLLATGLSLASIRQGLAYDSLALTSCFTALFQALTAVVFWNAWKHERGVIRSGAVAVFAVSTAASLARAIALVPQWHAETTFLPSNVFWLLTFIALDILQAGTLLFMVNESLLDALQNLADHDTLTGLLNRGGMSRRMQRQFRRMRSIGWLRLGVMCLDLDHFKDINDTFGHGAGDDVLKCLGRLLLENSRLDDLPSRQGGEEFCVVVAAATEEELLRLAERIRSTVEQAPCPTRMGLVPITISIGAALSLRASESFEDLFERADHALLLAKRTGRNRVVLAP